LRPAAGEIWTEGESYTIRWRAAGIARVNVGLAIGGKDKGHAALDLPASADSLRWRVPQGFVVGSTWIARTMRDLLLDSLYRLQRRASELGHESDFGAYVEMIVRVEKRMKA
jgi:hypothetical protein